MKKSIKKIISLVIAMALTISGITYSTVAKADESEGSWKTDAVKVPSEGQLVGAGYIDVEFDNSMEGYTYYFTYQLKRTKRRLMILKSSVRIGIVYIQKRELLIYVIGGKKLKTM